MLLDLGWGELLLIGIVALIVVGPKDLPGMFRALGRFTAKARNMAREFQRAMDDAADQAGVKDMANDLRDAANPRKMGLDKLNAAAEKFEKWEPRRTGTPPSTGPTPGPATAAMTEERQAQTDRIRRAMEAKGQARLDAERAAAEAAAPGPETRGDA